MIDLGRSPFAAGSMRPSHAPPDIAPTPETRGKVESLIADILDVEASLNIVKGRSRLVVAGRPITRISVGDPAVLRITPFSATQIELRGVTQGETSLLLWFNDTAAPLRYLVRVGTGTEATNGPSWTNSSFSAQVAELVPNSSVQMFSAPRKWIVRGQASDPREAVLLRQLISGR